MAVDLRSLVRAQAEGKAFNPSPAWEDPGRPVGFVDLNLGRIAGQSPSRGGLAGQRLTQRGAQTHMGAYGGKQAMDWVADCVRYWADAVASAEYHFEKPKKRTAVKKPGEPVDAPEDLEKLLDNPNPYMEYTELVELLVMDLLLVGNAYWFKWRIKENGRPLAIYRLAPPYVEVATTPWGPGAYVYQIPNADRMVIEPDEIIHFKLANPDSSNPYYGAGIIQTAGRAADLEIALTHTQSAYYENRAMPSVAVESERRVPRDVFKKMRAQLRARSQGPRNAGELLVLEAGLKLNSIAPNATDAAFVAVSKMSRDRVFGWFKMHPCLIGITDTGVAAGFLSEMKRQWDNTAARPFMDRVHKKITNELTKDAWNLEYVIDYEYQLTPEDRAKLAGSVGQLPGIQVDESREIGGYGPHPEKDIGEMTLNLPGQDGGTGQPGETPSRNGFPDRNLPGEAGRPPKAGNTKAFPKKGQKVPAGSSARRAKGKALTVDEISERLDELVQTPLERQPVDQLQNRRVADVDHVTASFESDLGRAAHVLERGLLDTVEGKALDDEILSKLRKSQGWESFDDLAKEAYEHALLKVMSAAAVHHSELGLKPAGEIDYQALIDELVAHKEGGVAAITKSFKGIVSKSVKDAKKEGADRAGIQKAVQQAIQKWVRDKAPMIAITEATRGYNESTLDVAKKSGFSHVYVSDGVEDDQPCIEANGSTWTLEYAKDHILEHPRCRRALVPIVVP